MIHMNIYSFNWTFHHQESPDMIMNEAETISSCFHSERFWKRFLKQNKHNKYIKYNKYNKHAVIKAELK